MFEQKAEEVAEMLKAKNRDYASSYDSSEDLLKLLYPDGINVEDYEDAVSFVKVFDCYKRLIGKTDAEKHKFYSYIAGYGILGMIGKDNEKE